MDALWWPWQLANMTRAMETLQQIQETLAEINERTPHVSISRFVASVLVEWLQTEYATSERKSVDAAGHGRDGDAEPSGARPGAPTLQMDWAACVVPLHGEDAHFGHAEAGVVGVADGVGGYRDRGVDAGAFARALMANALASAERVAKASRKVRCGLCPKKELERAHKKAAADETPGASTAVILSLHGTALAWAYIGDSAFAVLRGGKIICRSEQQQRRFNQPYQLSSEGSGGSLDEAKVGSMPTVMHGDVVVVATDGLFDNMHDWQLERAVRMGTCLGFSPKNMADIVAGIAYGISKDNLARTPFGIGYLEGHGEVWHGGKKDDITVIVAYIV
jgi:protein phosphatase PTC7